MSVANTLALCGERDGQATGSRADIDDGRRAGRKDPQRFFYDELGFRPGDQRRMRDDEVASPELAGADDESHGLPSYAASDGCVEKRVESIRHRFTAAGEKPGRVPAEDVAGEHVGVERGGPGRVSGSHQPSPALGDPLVQVHECRRRWWGEPGPHGVAGSFSADAFSFSDWS
jgi:hypothetical protein